jgi:hypothetical protein
MPRVRVCPSPGAVHAKTVGPFHGKSDDENCRCWLDRRWAAGKKQELAIMSRKLNGHLAVVGLGLLAATAPFDRAAATQDGPPTVSPAARWLQLAIDTTPKNTPAPKVKKLDLPKRDLPKQRQGGAPAGPSEKTKPSKKTDLTPPDPSKKPVDQTNVKLVPVQDPKFGPLKVTPEAKAAYLALPASARAQLSDPKGGAQVSAAALQQLAVHLRGFKPPAKPNLPEGAPCGPPGSVGSDFYSDGKGGCHLGVW